MIGVDTRQLALDLQAAGERMWPAMQQYDWNKRDADALSPMSLSGMAIGGVHGRAGVRYVRYYADASGMSHTEDVEVALTPQPVRSACPAARSFCFDRGKRICLCAFPGGLGGRLASNTPSAVCSLPGRRASRGRRSDGEHRVCGPGSVVLLEDTTGVGHRSRVIGDKAVIAAIVQLPPNE